MKKMFLLTTLFMPLFSYALTKNDLEKAIRSLDIMSVKQIIETEKFTSREYSRYLDLAEEVVLNRELWATKTYPLYDTTTPYEGPSLKRLIPEAYIGWIALKKGIDWTKMCLFARHYIPKELFAVGAIVSLSVVGKVICDLKNRLAADNAYREMLQKKYDDAVTIKQLIYTADVIEA